MNFKSSLDYLPCPLISLKSLTTILNTLLFARASGMAEKAFHIFRIQIIAGYCSNRSKINRSRDPNLHNSAYFKSAWSVAAAIVHVAPWHTPKANRLFWKWNLHMQINQCQTLSTSSRDFRYSIEALISSILLVEFSHRRGRPWLSPENRTGFYVNFECFPPINFTNLSNEHHTLKLSIHHRPVWWHIVQVLVLWHNRRDLNKWYRR